MMMSIGRSSQMQWGLIGKSRVHTCMDLHCSLESPWLLLLFRGAVELIIQHFSAFRSIGGL